MANPLALTLDRQSSRTLVEQIVEAVNVAIDRRSLRAGDALDFWRVLLADPAKGRLMLYAEMKLPGEA